MVELGIVLIPWVLKLASGLPSSPCPNVRGLKNLFLEEDRVVRCWAPVSSVSSSLSKSSVWEVNRDRCFTHNLHPCAAVGPRLSLVISLYRTLEDHSSRLSLSQKHSHSTRGPLDLCRGFDTCYQAGWHQDWSPYSGWGPWLQVRTTANRRGPPLWHPGHQRSLRHSLKCTKTG